MYYKKTNCSLVANAFTVGGWAALDNILYVDFFLLHMYLALFGGFHILVRTLGVVQ